MNLLKCIIRFPANMAEMINTRISNWFIRFVTPTTMSSIRWMGPYRRQNSYEKMQPDVEEVESPKLGT
jgi:hypothetical protein